MSTAPSVAAGLSLAAVDPVAACGLGEPVDGIDVDLGDGVGVLVGDLLDLDAALRPTACRGAAWRPGRA